MAWKNLTEHRKFLKTPEGQQHIAEIKEWRESLAIRRALGPSAPDVVVPTAAMFGHPGEIERLLDGIKSRFLLADSCHRSHIDREVMLCMRIAKLMNGFPSRMRQALNGEWFEHWRKSDKNPSESLKFVYSKVHADPKKASFYYRATRILFEEAIDPNDLPKRVSAAGGYGALAAANVRFPRKKKGSQPNGIVNSKFEKQPRKPSHKIQIDDDPIDPDRRRLSRPPSQHKHEGGSVVASNVDFEEDGTILFATFEGEGYDFLKIPTPNDVMVCMQIEINGAGKRLVKIYAASVNE